MVPDYYAMLGVDPAADRGAIEAALARQQPIWSSGTRNPKNKHTFQSYLDQIPALRQTLLGDAAVRAAYDAERAAARRAERDQKLDALQHLVQLRAAKGGLTVSDRALLRDEALKLGLAADDLDRLVESIPPRPEAPAEVDDVDPPADVLDSVTRRQIRMALEHLRRKDLYDALGLGRDVPGSEITGRADVERQRWMQKSQVTAEKTAWLEVVSLAQSHLTQPSARARYDRTLAIESEESFLSSIEFAIKGLERLDPSTRDVLVELGTRLGIEPSRAERLIGRVCRKLGVARESSFAHAKTNGAVRLLRCRACSGVTDHRAVASATKAPECRHCRASLHWKCPVCHRLRWVDEPRCACGFRVELAEPLLRHFEAAQQAFRLRDLDAAVAHLERVLDFAANHGGARKAIAKVRERKAEIVRARAAWESAISSGRLVGARAAVDAWSRLVDHADPDLKAAWADVNRKMRDAQSLLQQARALETTDPKAARALYRQCLALAADLPEAAAGMDRCPPDPPTDLRAEFAGDRVRLRWTPPAANGAGPSSYVILRKPGAAFLHPHDGTRIGEVNGTEYEDRQVNNGDSVSYAVLSKRGSVLSLAAVSLGPIVLLGDVSDVRVETRSREVDLSWSAPAKAHQVLVVRKVGSPPTSPKDGERIESFRDRALDRGLVDDRVYHYAIFAVYKGADGRLIPSPGILVSAQPHEPVAPLPAPRLSLDRPGRLKLAWPTPPRGNVKVVRTAAPIPHEVGARLTPREADGLEGTWLEAAAPDFAFDPSPPSFGACYYTPLTLWAGMLTVGESISYSCIPDPADLRANRVGNGGRVHLRWRWSPQGSESRLVARQGTRPTGPDDPEAILATIHEGEYSRRGYFSMTLPATPGGPWHIGVYAVASLDGERIYSPGLEPTAWTVVPGPHPEITVSYTFRRPKFPGRPWFLTFRTEPAGAAIPPTALVTHPRTVPLSADDGEIVSQFPAASDGATFPISSRIDLSTHRARIFADPTVDPDTLPPIRLRHPETAATRA